MSKRLGLWVARIAALAAVACNPAVPEPTAELESSKQSIRAAQVEGAEAEPVAARHLALARSQLTRAQQLIDAGDNYDAQLFLQRAEADAQLALSLAREASVKAQAQQAIQAVHAIGGQP